MCVSRFFSCSRSSWARRAHLYSVQPIQWIIAEHRAPVSHAHKANVKCAPAQLKGKCEKPSIERVHVYAAARCSRVCIERTQTIESHLTARAVLAAANWIKAIASTNTRHHKGHIQTVSLIVEWHGLYVWTYTVPLVFTQFRKWAQVL